MAKRGKVLGTIKRGRVKIRSRRQMRYLHEYRIDHTHYVRRKGKLIKRRHVY